MFSDFQDFYSQLYQSDTGEGLQPLPYQTRFAHQLISDAPPNCLGVPTGCGKESTVIAGFLWQWQQIKRWRRLAYTLPTRVLVDQVQKNTAQAIQNVNIDVEIYVLKGGAVDRSWIEYPEKPCMIIGTQDQLLSRALNRGYAQSPYQWPIDFGLLSQDTLWVFDETQLMGAGFDTSLQLQGLRDRFLNFKPTHSIWLSATLDESRLSNLIDYQQPLHVVRLDHDDLKNSILKQRLNARKTLHRWENSSTNLWEDLATDAIAKVEQGKVLIVVNQVKRAIEIAKALEKLNANYKLVHSRFRECDRPKIEELKIFPGIIVTTQAIEAGVDLDAKTLFSELCPWPSFVQRVGRCNRKGEFNDANVYWINVEDKDALPYEAEDLKICRTVLENTDEIGIDAINNLQNQYQIKFKREITPIPRQKDLLELFHTDEDLQGSRTDVSPFVRGLKDEDVQIGWRDFDSKPDPERGELRQEELCRVRIGTAKSFLKGKKAYIWNYTKSQKQYESVNLNQIIPGTRILLHCSEGGYSEKFGFTGNCKDQPNDLNLAQIPHESFDDDNNSHYQQQWVTLRQHSDDVAKNCETLSELLPENLRREFIQAGRWHDYGKAHPEWQCAVDAKTDNIYAKIARWKGTGRLGIRHELASMLAARNEQESTLVQYLILCHHGKIRTCIEPGSKEDKSHFVRGISSDDSINRDIDLGEGLIVKPQTFDCLTAVAYWNGDWIDDVEELLEQYGPFSLAYLEALLRMADWKASKTPSTFETDLPPFSP